MTKMLKGIAASDGVAVAKAYLLVQPDLSFETISVEDTNAEEARLDAALEASQNELSLIRENAVASLGVGQGADVVISAEGADADDALAAIAETMEKEGLA